MNFWTEVKLGILTARTCLQSKTGTREPSAATYGCALAYKCSHILKAQGCVRLISSYHFPNFALSTFSFFFFLFSWSHGYRGKCRKMGNLATHLFLLHLIVKDRNYKHSLIFQLVGQSCVYNLLNSWLHVLSCLNYLSLPNVTFIHSAKRELYVRSNSICSLYLCVFLLLLEGLRNLD